MTRLFKHIITTLLLWCVYFVAFGGEQRIEDLTSIKGVRDNQLIGYGLVVGLDGTGDSDPFTSQSIKNMLNNLGLTLPARSNPKSKNVAAVIITSNLPPFSHPGQKIDVTVSAVGNAKSLRGGTLLMTPLKGADGHVYALSQGNVVVGGFAASGQSGSALTKNVPSVGRIPNGATVERSVESPFGTGDHITFLLHRPSFSTAKRVATEINRFIGSDIAEASDATTIRVDAPLQVEQRVGFIATLQDLSVVEAPQRARVIVNSRSGTIVIGESVTMSPAAVSHGDLVVNIQERENVVQPNALGGGTTEKEKETNIIVTEEKSNTFLLQPQPTLRDIVQALNSVGAPPQALITILQALKEAGALHGELIVI